MFNESKSYWTASTLPAGTSGFDVGKLTAMMQDVRKRISVDDSPTAMVMTEHTYRLLKAQIDQQPRFPEQSQATDAVRAIPMTFHGVPIETFGTVRQCLDRMLAARSEERLKLCLTENMPEDCVSHPYMIQIARKLAKRYEIQPFEFRLYE